MDLDSLFLEMNPIMLRIASSFIWNTDEAADFVCDTWLDFINRLNAGNIDPSKNVEGYLVVMTRTRALNKVRDDLRRNRMIGSKQDDEIKAISSVDPASTLERELQWERAKSILKACLNELRDIYRIPILLFGVV